MKHFLDRLQSHYGIDRLTLGLLVGSLSFYLVAWWLRETTLKFNSTVFLIGGGVILVNTALIGLFARREQYLAYLFGGAALFYQILLVILLVMAARGLLG